MRRHTAPEKCVFKNIYIIFNIYFIENIYRIIFKTNEKKNFVIIAIAMIKYFFNAVDVEKKMLKINFN